MQQRYPCERSVACSARLCVWCVVARPDPGPAIVRGTGAHGYFAMDFDFSVMMGSPLKCPHMFLRPRTFADHVAAGFSMQDQSQLPK